jgi:hypothetical protein
VYSESIASDKEKYGFYVPIHNEEIYGTWVNAEYSGALPFFQKAINYHWGYYDVFCKMTDTNACIRGTMILVDKWTDSEGNIWYKQYFRENWGYSGFFEIDKISKNNTVWEFVFSSLEFPVEDDLSAKNTAKGYHIYYRQ